MLQGNVNGIADKADWLWLTLFAFITTYAEVN